MQKEQQQWFERWEQGRIGFHQDQVNPWLREYAHKLQADAVLLPLCGKSLDILYLAKQGKKVLGVELVPQAVQAFFTENHLPVQQSLETAFHQSAGNVYRLSAAESPSLDIRIYQGDFFDFTSPFCCDVYDRAALIALPPALRQSYAEKILQVLDSTMLLLTLEYEQKAMNGPPYNVSPAEVQQLYANCRIQQLTKEYLPRGELPCYQQLYLIEKRP